MHLLFLSHFDSDHVSGLKTLLQSVKIDTVVVPYLDELARAVVLVHAVADRQPTTELRRLLFDQAGWFGRRGVRRLIEVAPGPPVPDSFAGGRPEGLESGGGGFDAILLSPFKEPIETPPGRGPRSASEAQVPAGSSFAVNGPDHWSEFVFLPYVFNATDIARRRAKEVIERFLGVPINSSDFRDRLLEKIRSRKGRKAIAALYSEAGLGDANAISMSLYCGSVRTDSARYRLGNGHYWPPGRAGWLLTGDAKLRSPTRRQEWLQYFGTLKSNIGLLMLPHHGSAANFDRDILDAVPDEAALYVTADAKDHGVRPHEDVLAQLGERELLVVTEQPQTTLRQISGPSFLTGYGGAITRFCSDWH